MTPKQNVNNTTGEKKSASSPLFWDCQSMLQTSIVLEAKQRTLCPTLGRRVLIHQGRSQESTLLLKFLFIFTVYVLPRELDETATTIFCRLYIQQYVKTDIWCIDTTNTNTDTSTNDVMK